MVWATYALEGEVVGVATGKVEVLAIELEDAILGSDESSRGLAGGLLGGGIGSSSQKAEGHGADGVEEHCELLQFSVNLNLLIARHLNAVGSCPYIWNYPSDVCPSGRTGLPIEARSVVPRPSKTAIWGIQVPPWLWTLQCKDRQGPGSWQDFKLPDKHFAMSGKRGPSA